MSVKRTDKLMYAKPRLNGKALLARLDQPDEKDAIFLAHLVAYSEVAGLDDAVLADMWLVETANGTSERWNIDLNAGGIGIPSDSTLQPFKIADAGEAARIFVQCVYSLVNRRLHDKIPVPAAAQEWFSDVWLPKVTSKQIPTVATVADLNLHYADARGELQATWAWNPNHIDVLLERAAVWLPDVPDQTSGGGPIVSTPTTKLVFGRVPIPAELELHDIVSNGPNTAFDYLGVRRNLGTCTHRMVGSLLGTHGYFQGEAAGKSLTDFGIGGTWDGDLNGTAYQWVPKGIEIAPWANGPATDLEGDGVAFVQALGINAVNRDIRAIELSDGGNYLDPWGPEAQAKQWATYIALMAYLFDQAEVPWDSYPVNPAVEVVTDLEHWEIGPKECPFGPVRQLVNQRQAAIRAVLKMHQTGVGTTPEPIPAPKPVIIPYSASLDQTFLKRRWGSLKRVYVNGEPARDPETKRVKYYRWNPKWVPCSAWVARAKEAGGEYPKPGDWTSIAKPKKGGPVSQIEFENGWVLLHFDDSRGWRWAGDETETISA